MLFLQPFGLSALQTSNKFWFLCGYGLVSFLVLAFNVLFVIKFFSKYIWTIKLHILWRLWVVFYLGLANYIYTYFILGHLHFSWLGILIFQLYTMLIAVVPITILVLITQNRLLKTNQINAEIINGNLNLHHHTDTESTNKFTFTADNEKNQFTISPVNLAFIESIGNYIHIHYYKEHEICTAILRSNLTKAVRIIENQPYLIKCHRAFIVNLNHIEDVQGNAQGYRVKIKKSKGEVYVSRQFTKVFKARIDKSF